VLNGIDSNWKANVELPTDDIYEPLQKVFNEFLRYIKSFGDIHVQYKGILDTLVNVGKKLDKNNTVNHKITNYKVAPFNITKSLNKLKFLFTVGWVIMNLVTKEVEDMIRMAVDIRFDLKTRIYRFAGAQTVFDVFKNNEDRFSGTIIGHNKLLIMLLEG
jgi:hypothetical protein